MTLAALTGNDPRGWSARCCSSSAGKAAVRRSAYVPNHPGLQRLVPDRYQRQPGVLPPGPRPVDGLTSTAAPVLRVARARRQVDGRTALTFAAGDRSTCGPTR